MQSLRSWLAAAAGLLAAATAPALAATVVSEAALLAALEADPILEAAVDAPAAAARASLPAAGKLSAPALAAAREDAGDSGVESLWSARWELPLPGRPRLLRAHAAAALRLAEQGAEAARLHLRTALRAAYAGWALAGARREISAEHAAALADLARFAAARAEAGEAPGIAARRVELLARRARSTAGRDAAAETQARGGVEGLAGALPAGAVPALPALPPLPVDLGAEGSLAAHPELQAARLEEEQERLAVELARRSFPMPEVELGWKRSRAGEVSFEGPAFGVSWPLPLPSRRRAAIAAAEAAHGGARARRLRRELELRAALAAHEAAFARLWDAAAAAPGDDPGLRDATTLSFRLGEATLTELLDTLEELREARVQKLDLLAEALAAHRSLELAAGRPLELTP